MLVPVLQELAIAHVRYTWSALLREPLNEKLDTVLGIYIVD